MPDSYDPSVSWLTEGIAGDFIGDFGLGNGGAAGIEVDRYHLDFGTPPNAKVIASSGGHPDNYVAHDEEGAYSHQGFSGTHNYVLRADLIFFPLPTTVPFSLWDQSLSEWLCQSIISTITCRAFSPMLLKRSSSLGRCRMRHRSVRRQTRDY
jgi:hypothetical protein